MFNRVSLRWAAIACALIVWGDARECAAQYGSPPWAGSTLRGRYHYYNGPSVSYGHGRWGGGISNNGALVLNNLISTAGVVAPAILPMFLPQLPTGSVDESASPESESVFDSEPIDPNRDARRVKITESEERTRLVLARLKIEEPASLPATPSPATTPKDQDGNDSDRPNFTPGIKP